MFKFEKTKDPNNEFDTFSTTMVVDNDISWPDLLEQFYSFLLSCGYSISKKKFIEEFGDMVEAEVQPMRSSSKKSDQNTLLRETEYVGDRKCPTVYTS